MARQERTNAHPIIGAVVLQICMIFGPSLLGLSPQLHVIGWAVAIGFGLAWIGWFHSISEMTGRSYRRVLRLLGRVPDKVVVCVIATLAASVLYATLLRTTGQQFVYRTGNFGEPPHNRYVQPHLAYNKQRDVHMLLVEFGVSLRAVPNPAVGIVPRVPKNTLQVVYWKAPPDLSSMPDGTNYQEPTGQFEITVGNDAIKPMIIAAPRLPVFPSKSIYLYLESTRPLPFSGTCVFGNREEERALSCQDPLLDLRPTIYYETPDKQLGPVLIEKDP